jgi:hypothetical protein
MKIGNESMLYDQLLRLVPATYLNLDKIDALA